MQWNQNMHKRSMSLQQQQLKEREKKREEILLNSITI